MTMAQIEQRKNKAFQWVKECVMMAQTIVDLI